MPQLTDEAYDAQTLATSARIERLHRLRFGPQARTWTCPECLRVNRATTKMACGSTHCGSALALWLADFGKPKKYPCAVPFSTYGQSDPEELIYSRAN